MARTAKPKAGTGHSDPRFDDAVAASAIVPFRGRHAIICRAEFTVSPQRMFESMLAFDRFAKCVPLIDRGESQALPGGGWQVRLSGKLGIWKFGIPIDMRFEMQQIGPWELAMSRYLGGSFGDMHFHHRLLDVTPTGGTLESLYFFDMTEFALIQRLPVMRTYPWMHDEIQMVAGSMMVRGLIDLANS